MIAQFSEASLTEWRRPFDFPPTKCELRSDHLHQSLPTKGEGVGFSAYPSLLQLASHIRGARMSSLPAPAQPRTTFLSLA